MFRLFLPDLSISIFKGGCSSFSTLSCLNKKAELIQGKGYNGTLSSLNQAPYDSIGPVAHTWPW